MGQRDDSRPTVSVVVAAFSGAVALARCLESLNECAASAEHVVATNLEPVAVAQLEARFPNARFFCFPKGTDVFQLRSLGLVEARGGLVALIEDHCTVAPGWLEALVEGRRAGYAVVGGSVGNGLKYSAYHWALYLCEYGMYMPPMPTGPASAVSAVNAAYDREALWSCRAVWESMFHDNEVHDALRAAGHRLYLAGEARAFSHLAMPIRVAMLHLFAGGRRFGGYRKSRSSGIKRLFWIATVPLVALVLFGRIARRVATQEPMRLRFLLLALPFVIALLLAWTAGEAWGLIASESRAVGCSHGEK